MNGRVIAGRYELAAILGQGGMGQVWTAYDQRLDRRVAVKLLRPDRVAGPSGSDAADELRRRFVRECRVTAQVDHPGLVTVHDAGSDDDDLYLVMQYVEGADLADHLPPPLCRRVTSTLAGGGYLEHGLPRPATGPTAGATTGAG